MKKDNGPLVPKQVITEITSHCNLKCKLCPFSAGGYEKQHMRWTLFEHLVNETAKLKHYGTTIIPWLNGEPMLYPFVRDAFKLINEKEIKWYITTNGHFCYEEVFHEMLRPGTSCYQIIFSLDGLFEEWEPRSRSIEIARPGSDREMVQRTIERVMTLKQELRSNVELCVKICKRGQDWEEIENYIQFWLMKGIDFVCVGEPLTGENDPSMRIYPCQQSYNNFLYIRAGGDVTRCSYNIHAQNEPETYMGKVDEQTDLVDFYNNEAFTTLRKEHETGNFSHPCDSCAFPYTGYGFEGKVKFRHGPLKGVELFHRRDYYNNFFSFKDMKKEDSYYEIGTLSGRGAIATEGCL